MTHIEFTQHAEAIRSAIIIAIEGYMVRNGLPWSQTAFVEQKETDLTQAAKEALFYGADVVPEETLPS